MANPSANSDPVTLEDVARRVGVSARTVRRALDGGRVAAWDCTARREEAIRRAAEELGYVYRPNAAARTMTTGRFNSVSLLMSTRAGQGLLIQEMLDGICDELEEWNLHLSLIRLPDRQLTDADSLPKVFREGMTDGLLIDYFNEIPAGMEAAMNSLDIPTVWINSQHPADCAYFADAGAARRAVEEMIKAGHRRILYADFSNPAGQTPRHYTGTERRRGYEQAMTAAGLKPLILQENVPHLNRVAFARDWLCQHRQSLPTAAFCYHISSAISLREGARDAGLRLPDDLQVACFADRIPDLAYAEIPAMVNPWHDLGRAAARLLLAKIAAPGTHPAPVILPFTWVNADRLRPPANARKAARPAHATL